MPAKQSNWEGEVRILPGDTSFMPCGTHKALRLTGPGLDSIAQKYVYLVTKPGQWIKTWWEGNIAAAGDGKPDSVLLATRYLQMDAEVHCTPIPNKALAGSYLRTTPRRGLPSNEQLLFFPNGDATDIITNPDGMHVESDGRWGVNSDGQLSYSPDMPHFTFTFIIEQGQLVRILPNGKIGPTFTREGPADRMSGTAGRTARWLASVATAHGHTVLPEDLRPAMPLDSLFPNAASRAALRASAGDSLGMDEERLNSIWGTADKVGEVTILMRMHLRAIR